MSARRKKSRYHADSRREDRTIDVCPELLPFRESSPGDVRPALHRRAEHEIPAGSWLSIPRLEPLIMRARDLMKAPVQSVERSDTMGTAMQIMRQHGIRHLPVLENGKLIAILSDRDLLSPDIPGRWHKIPWSDTIAVEWVMSAPVLVLSPEATISEAASLMHAERIDCAPVVDDGKDRAAGAPVPN